MPLFKNMKLEGNIIDVLNEKIFPGEIFIRGKKIVEVIENNKKYKNFILPGFIDAHLHIESSLLSPSAFAREVARHGTTAVIADCHEIANVFGLKGIGFMIKASNLVPLKIYFAVPSCVPATPFEKTGVEIRPKEIKNLMSREKVVALGELMNFPGVINKDKEIMQKIKVAKHFKKPIDGHAPLLSGKDLKKYVSAGILTDHECVTLKEAKEKMRLGMKIMIREGSAAKNLKDLIGLDYDNCFLVSDDIEAKDLISGHLNKVVKKAITLGIPLMKAIKMVTLNPALHYKLDSGLITKGKKADLIEIDNLKNFKIKRVFIDGKLVAKKGKVLFPLKQIKIGKNIKAKKKKAQSLEIYSDKKEVTARVIQLIPDQIITKQKFIKLKTKKGQVIPDIKQDVLKIIVLNRYGKETVGKGFVRGFGFKKGAIASSVSHDSHNLIAVGVDDGSLARVINAVIRYGGLALVNNDKVLSMRLPLAGLMSLKEAPAIAKELEVLVKEAKKLGYRLANPFVALSFLALLVIPELKISDRGLFDVKKFSLVSNFLTKE